MATYEINISNDITFNESYDLVDTYINIGNTLNVSQELILGYSLTISFAHSLKLGQTIKAWDGSISTIVNMSQVALTNFFPRNISNEMEFVETWEHNWKLLFPVTDVTLDNDLSLAQFEEYELYPEDASQIYFQHDMVCTKESSRALSHDVNMLSEFQVYKITKSLSSDYGG